MSICWRCGTGWRSACVPPPLDAELNVVWPSHSWNASHSSSILKSKSPQHMCLGEWNSWERAPDNNLHKDSTYLQTYTEDNVQNTHAYTQYTQCTIRHTYSYQYTLYTVCTHSTHIYAHNNMWRCSRLYISRVHNVMDVRCMVSSDSR